jgi:hypothetical protein
MKSAQLNGTLGPTVKANNAANLEGMIDRYFDLFTPTTQLVERLIAARENAQDVLLLLCARL